MYKKMITMISVIFVLSLITLSCSSKDNTTSPISKNEGIKKHAGTWNVVFTDEPDYGYSILIGKDGSVILMNYKAYVYNIKDLGGDKYSMDVFSGADFTITLTFSDQNSGTILDSLSGEGTISKIN